MNRILITIFLYMASITAYAQTDKLITLKGDTVTGEALISSHKNSVPTVTIKNERSRELFKVYEIKELQMGDKQYRPIKVETQYQLGLVIIEGYLSWYKYQDMESTYAYDFSSSILVKLDGTQLVVPNLGFKKFLLKFLEDCKTVKEGFSNDVYKKNDLGKIVDDYNGCIEANTNKRNNETFKVDHNLDKVALVTTLIKSIQADESIADTETVVEMLNDLSSKIKADAKIPTYLESALRESLKSNANYGTELDKILK